VSSFVIVAIQLYIEINLIISHVNKSKYQSFLEMIPG
jgi:hypothetical protein